MGFSIVDRVLFGSVEKESGEGESIDELEPTNTINDSLVVKSGALRNKLDSCMRAIELVFDSVKSPEKSFYKTTHDRFKAPERLERLRPGFEMLHNLGGNIGDTRREFRVSLAGSTYCTSH